MIISYQMLNNFRGKVPDGFTLEPGERDSLVIYLKRTGMGKMNLFAFFFTAVWTVGSIFSLFRYFVGGVIEEGEPGHFQLIAGYWGVEILLASLLAYILFCKKSFCLDNDYLIMETDVLGLKWRKIIDKKSISKFVQLKDGGIDEESFPSWGLQIEGEKKATLIYRQPHEKSRWLGKLLSQWAGVKFVEVPDE